jgi:hypothetical protein
MSCALFSLLPATGLVASACSVPHPNDGPALHESDFEPATESGLAARSANPAAGAVAFGTETVLPSAFLAGFAASPAAVESPRAEPEQEPGQGQEQAQQQPQDQRQGPTAHDQPGAAPPSEEGENSAESLSKKLANPVASLISVPFQSNFDFGIGPDNGFRYTMNFQPVVPVSLTDDWNVIIRTIVPTIYQHDVVDDGGSAQFGLGDTTQSFFFSPKQPTSNGLVWGVGPVFLWPTGTNDSLGSEKWGIGPTGVFLWQDGPWTYGALLNHIWSYAGDDDRPGVNSTFLQPFVNYTTPTGFAIALNTESTYDWKSNEWTVPIGLFFSQIVRVGRLPVSIQFGPRFYIDTPDGQGPDLGFRLNITFLFPK